MRKKVIKTFQGTSLTTKHLIFGIPNEELNSTSVIRESPCHPEESTCTWAKSVLSGHRARPALLSAVALSHGHSSPWLGKGLGHCPPLSGTAWEDEGGDDGISGKSAPRHLQWSPPMLGTSPVGLGVNNLSGLVMVSFLPWEHKSFKLFVSMAPYLTAWAVLGFQF